MKNEVDLEKIETNGRLWEKYGKKRYYLSGDHYLEKANAFFSEKKDVGRFEWEFNNGFLYADKCFNGCLEESFSNFLK